ncbi:unnamed protein product [Ciceribacter selenitireducens ATCC BAA-1503]|uniref:Uncharacterized protein n=1 Tax=Ciceribacter selenitireducens ATCC BAA-1503 TaxID=1336235 RepID=A0A376AGY9_9HYPH|nr:unnamed protein product [Ciceribacter selenitireducens ATCC BAA-1503]
MSLHPLASLSLQPMQNDLKIDCQKHRKIHSRAHTSFDHDAARDSSPQATAADCAFSPGWQIARCKQVKVDQTTHRALSRNGAWETAPQSVFGPPLGRRRIGEKLTEGIRRKTR